MALNGLSCADVPLRNCSLTAGWGEVCCLWLTGFVCVCVDRRSLAAQQRSRAKEVLAQNKSMQTTMAVGSKAIQVRLMMMMMQITTHPQCNLGRTRHSRTTTQQGPHWLEWGAPNSPPKLPLTLGRSSPHLIHPSLDRPHSPSQTESESNQPFYHSTHSGQTDRQTNTRDRRKVSKKSAYAVLYS